MYKDIIFLEGVKQTTRQNVLNFVKTWNSNDKFITLYTSGSTGKPKKIVLSKTQIKASANATINFFNLKQNKTILLALSADYIAGKMMIVRAIENNMKIIVASLKSNPLLIDLPCKIDFAAFVPLQIHAIINHPKSKRNYDQISTVIIGGGIINQQLEKQLIKLNNLNYASFGMTETISHIALRNISKSEKHYTALPNVSFKKSTNDCLIINAPLINSTLNLQTTDCIDLLNEKQFIWKGRVDFVINSGGLKIHPENLEKKVEHLFPENLFYFIGEKDSILGEKIILIVENNPPLNYLEIQNKLKQSLSKYELPKEIRLKTKLPLTKTGKIIR